MAHTITFDLRKGTGVPEAFLMGSVEIEPTAMHTSGTALVFPAPIAVPITDGTATVDLDPSPAGEDPAWAYRIVVRETKTRRAWSEIVRVPDVAGPTAYTALERLSTGPSAPPLTTWGEIVAEANAAKTAAEDSATAAEAAAGLVGAPAGAAVLAAVSEGGAARGELNAAIAVGRGVDALEGVESTTFGSSYADTGASYAPGSSRWVSRLVRAQNMGTLTNRAVGGSRMDEALGVVKANWTPNSIGLVWASFDGINDVRQFADDAGRTTFREAFRSALAYLTSSAVLSTNLGPFVFGAGWTAGTTSTTGAHVDFAFTGKRAHLLVEFTTDAGGTVTVTDEAGAVIKTVTTGGYKRAFTGAIDLPFGTAATRDFRATVTAGTVTVTGLAVQTEYAPTIVWLKPGPYQSGYPSQATRLALYLAEAEPVAATFPTVIPVDITAAGGWDYQTMILASDGVHPNDIGSSFITAEANEAIKGVSFRQGLNRVDGPNPTYTSPTVNYVAPGATIPSAPTVTASTSQQATVSWTPGADGGATITGYEVQASADGTTWFSVGSGLSGSTTTYAVQSGLTQGSAYSFRVRAISSVGSGAWGTTSGTTTAGPVLTTYSADTFTRADSSTLGSTEVGADTWTPRTNAANWSISGNSLVCTSGWSTTPNDCYVDDGEVDGTISFKLNTFGTNRGAIVRASGNTGYLVYVNTSGMWTLTKRTASNTFTALVVSTQAAASGDNVAIVLNGTSITVKVNGATIISTTDASYNGTQHGFTGVSGAALSVDNWSHTSAIV